VRDRDERPRQPPGDVGRHATHSLVHADYRECGTLDEPWKLLHEGYWHNFVDDELVGTAMLRGTFAMAGDAHVEHLHPNWRKAADDETYRRGMASFHRRPGAPLPAVAPVAWRLAEDGDVVGRLLRRWLCFVLEELGIRTDRGASS
jgi:hypothetical protein